MQDLGLNPRPVELESALYQDPQVTHTLKVSEVLSKLLFSDTQSLKPTGINCFKNPFMYNSNMQRIDIDKYV